jgi:hypothetical protein
MVEVGARVLCFYHVDDGESQRCGAGGLAYGCSEMDSHRARMLSDTMAAATAGLAGPVGISALKMYQRLMEVKALPSFMH